MDGKETSYITGPDINTQISYKVQVLAFNDKEYKGAACYANANVTGCNKRGSGVVEVVYQPPLTTTTTTTKATTTPKSGAGSIYQLSLSVFIFLSSISLFLIKFLKL